MAAPVRAPGILVVRGSLIDNAPAENPSGTPRDEALESFAQRLDAEELTREVGDESLADQIAALSAASGITKEEAVALIAANLAYKISGKVVPLGTKAGGNLAPDLSAGGGFYTVTETAAWKLDPPVNPTAESLQLCTVVCTGAFAPTINGAIKVNGSLRVDVSDSSKVNDYMLRSLDGGANYELITKDELPSNMVAVTGSAPEGIPAMAVRDPETGIWTYEAIPASFDEEAVDDEIAAKAVGNSSGTPITVVSVPSTGGEVYRSKAGAVDSLEPVDFVSWLSEYALRILTLAAPLTASGPLEIAKLYPVAKEGITLKLPLSTNSWIGLEYALAPGKSYKLEGRFTPGEPGVTTTKTITEEALVYWVADAEGIWRPRFSYRSQEAIEALTVPGWASPIESAGTTNLEAGMAYPIGAAGAGATLNMPTPAPRRMVIIKNESAGEVKPKGKFTPAEPGKTTTDGLAAGKTVTYLGSAEPVWRKIGLF